LWLFSEEQRYQRPLTEKKIAIMVVKMMMTARTTIKIRFWMILKKSRRDKKPQ